MNSLYTRLDALLRSDAGQEASAQMPAQQIWMRLLGLLLRQSAR